ncbi:MAG: ABC transporter permease [Immundisolibacterales bacterium]|nr:ABC transporter permease [Immundisolibacterales bacterium]
MLTTADGAPLKVSFDRALRRSRLKALALVLPLFAFLLITFLVPIGDMLLRSVENQLVGNVLHRTVKALDHWDQGSGELPDEEAFAALVADFQEGRENRTIGRVGVRLNYESGGMSSLFRKTGRRAKRITEAPFREAMIKLDKRWGNLDVWRLIKRESDAYTASYYLSAVDMRFIADGSIARQDENRQIYVRLFGRTLWLSLVITVLCLLLGYPISYLMATLPVRTSNLLMIMVLLPFWTSLLVRTTCWIALLQQQGVINDLLVWVGIIGEDNRLAMIHNRTGTIIAMTHILLPFMVLPLYSVMKTIPPSYLRAARSLGANPFTAFVRVYMPNTVAGVGAGSILVFIIAIGYYITPALVGGTSGTLISNFIAHHMQVSLNWGLAAALGALLLAAVLALYVLYDKIVGIDNMKLG